MFPQMVNPERLYISEEAGGVGGLSLGTMLS